MRLTATRTNVRFVTCPYCGAPRKLRCQGKVGLRHANHRERIAAFIEWRTRLFARHVRGIADAA